jgi:hypothetical protein
VDRLDPKDERYDTTPGSAQSGYSQDPDRPMTTDPGYSQQPGAPMGTDPGYGQPAGAPMGTDPGYNGTTAADAGYAGGAAGGFDPWNRSDQADWNVDQDVVGYHVEANDGRIGKIDEASTAVDASYLVVDTGPWIFGKKVMLPAGVINRVDNAERTVFVNCSKEQIKSSPEFDANTYSTSEYRDQLGGYYSSGRGADFDHPGSTDRAL